MVYKPLKNQANARNKENIKTLNSGAMPKMCKYKGKISAQAPYIKAEYLRKR